MSIMSQAFQAPTIIQLAIYALAWSGLVLAYIFAMWEGGILYPWSLWLQSQGEWANMLGRCWVCFTFWFGLIFCDIFISNILKDLLVFGGISTGIIVVFTCYIKLNFGK